MPDIINVVEPTLTTEAGHCYSFISALCKATDESRTLRLWVGRHAELTFARKNIQIRKYFTRKIRRLQSYFLYKKLLAMPEKLFISTAGRTDLLMLDWASRGVVPPEKVYLYFHWFNTNDKKLASLRKIACRQPNLEILGPTPSVVKVFQDAGFSNAHVVPYPISKQDVSHQAEPDKFRHLLYAGAARQDKGFSHVVDLVAYLHERGSQIPVTLQTSPEYYGKYDAATQADIQRLRAIAYPHLQLRPETLSASEYADLFAGAICLQLYDSSDFSDRISGVTLDAFSAGCPIVATAGTWIARMAQRFDAGVAVNEMSPPQVLSAVQGVITEYARYNQHAREAGRILQEENSAGTLFRALARRSELKNHSIPLGGAMPDEKLQLLHIVRRYGPVGGMERYVWELTRELQRRGHQVTVLCEHCHAEKPDGIEVHELGEIAPRPHWLSQLRFSGRVTAWLKAHPHSGWLIHSHERVKVHHVTTFHGPPFATIFERSFWRWISLRVWMRLYLERRELTAARAIVPNSEFIKGQLLHYYPQQQPKLTTPIVPGVTPSVVREWRVTPQDGGIVGFVGKEWQRKGLPLVAQIVAQLRRKRPNLELWVIGPEPQEVQHLFNGWQGGYRLLGWRSDTEYLGEIDVLLHPAKAEPYGMVISEAMAACVPVVVSDVCGAAAQVSAESGQVLSLSDSSNTWAKAVERELARTSAPPQFVHGWDRVAGEYEGIYRQIIQA